MRPKLSTCGNKRKSHKRRSDRNRLSEKVLPGVNSRKSNNKSNSEGV